MQPETEDLGLVLPFVSMVEGRAESGLKADNELWNRAPKAVCSSLLDPVESCKRDIASAYSLAGKTVPQIYAAS